MTTLTVGGSDQAEIFQYLSPQQAARLQEKAQALLNIPSEKRIPFMVKQMKQALSFKGLRGVEKVDPSWLLQAMRGESPRTVAAILVTLPPPVVRSILKRLPAGVRKNLPPKEQLKHVPVELVRAVRHIFESHFHAMPTTIGKGFAFRDIIHLERKELYKLMRDLGLVELGQAFAAVGKLALAELCRRLPRSKAEELIMSVRRSLKIDAPDLKTAQRFLSRVVVNFDDTEEFFQKAGLWRVAKACLLEDEAFRAAFRQRMPREAGELFDEYLQKAAQMEDLSEEVLQRLQDLIVARVKTLSDRESISPRWGQLKLDLHDPTFLETLAQAEAELGVPPPSEPAPEDVGPPDDAFDDDPDE
jgi:hypothetical protein